MTTTIEQSLLRLGQHVHCILYGGKDGVITEIQGEQRPDTCQKLGAVGVMGGNATIVVTWENGTESHVPETLVRGSVQWHLIDEPDLTPDQLQLRMIEAKLQRAALELDCQDKANQHEAEKNRLIAELRAKYPWAAEIKAKGMTGAATAAACIKRELNDAFPGTSFSVKSRQFAGGNDVTIGWDLGPTTKQVEAITSKYQDGHFDGMDDSYKYDHSPMAEAVGIVLAQAKYVSESRHTPDELDARVIEDLAKLYSAPNKWELEREARQLLGATEFKPGEQYAGIEQADERAGRICEIFRIVKNAAAPPPVHEATASPTHESASGATITKNAAKNGVEIRFASKPSESVLASLKSNGWRWSRFAKLWYHRDTPAAMAFAESIIAIQP